MCYGNCKYERNFSGLCNNPEKYSRFIDSECCTDFICTHCKEQHTEEEMSDFDGICIDCAPEYFKCRVCETVKSIEEDGQENGICFDCIEEGNEVNQELLSE